MTARLDPETSLAYLESLHADVRSAALLGPGGEVLAGGSDPPRDGRRVVVEAGGVSLVVETVDPLARRGGAVLGGLLRADMRAALEAVYRP